MRFKQFLLTEKEALAEGPVKDYFAKKGMKMVDVWEKVVKEIKQSKDAYKILSKRLRKESITPDERAFLTEQVFDIFKALGLGAAFMAPLGGIAVTLLIKYAHKFGLQPLPSSFR